MRSTGHAIVLACTVLTTSAAAQGPGTVLAEQKISDTQGGFTGTLAIADQFGTSVTLLGDLDGDGTADVAVGAPGDDDGGNARGAVWILFLHPDGTVKSHQKISDTQGGFSGVLGDASTFGRDVAGIGDLDGDGTLDLAVGAPGDDEGGNAHGAVWILFLKTDGTVKAHQKINDVQGGFSGSLADGDGLGHSLALLGDLDDDGTIDLAAGAVGDGDGGLGSGAVWILFLKSDGTVLAEQKISQTQGSFTGTLDSLDQFGARTTSPGDLDGDGVEDLVAGAPGDDDGGADRGAVWILFLETDGTVKSHQKISSTQGGFTGSLDDVDIFGISVASLGDLDGDGTTDIGVGVLRDDDGATDAGAVWHLFLNPDGTVQGHQKVSATAGGFSGVLSDSDFFGHSITSLGDLDGDGRSDSLVGASGDDDGGSGHGAVWVLLLDGVAPAQVLPYGCGVNPPDSLTLISGLPSIGTTITLGVDNPLGTQPAGSLPFLAIAFQPDPAFPCGASLPGFGMGGPGASGELLIPFNPPFVFAGPPWAGASNPTAFALPVPNLLLLLGVSVYTQGLMYAPAGAFGVTFGLTEAFELVVGP